jgi:hypothetical protein
MAIYYRLVMNEEEVFRAKTYEKCLREMMEWVHDDEIIYNFTHETYDGEAGNTFIIERIVE